MSQPFPVSKQPGPIQWIPLQPNCPIGLEYLSTLNHVFVFQRFEPLEFLTGFETKNVYEVLNNFESDTCARQCYGENRAFVLHLYDCLNREVIRIIRPLNTCCNPEVRDMTEQQVGEVRKVWGGLFREKFTKADQFGISFPIDLSVHLKALLIGACFLIDFKYFERHNRHH